MTTTVSPQGVAFTGRNEGFVSHFYKDSGGVGTIGHGFTMLSKVFAAYWLASRGHKLRAGDTITEAESLQILSTLINEEYAPPVARALPKVNQNEFDASADVVYNCGAGTLKDRWAVALADGEVTTAANLLLTTRITAKGKVLAGLKTRRRNEATRMLTGDTGHEEVVTVNPADAAAAARSQAATKAKQIATQGAGAGATTGAAGGAATHQATVVPGHVAAVVDNHALLIHALSWGLGIGLAVLAAVGIGYLIYSHRGVILGKRTPA